MNELGIVEMKYQPYFPCSAAYAYVTFKETSLTEILINHVDCYCGFIKGTECYIPLYAESFCLYNVFWFQVLKDMCFQLLADH